MFTRIALRRAGITGLLVVLLVAAAGAAMRPDVEARQVKAAMILNMLHFVTWRELSDATAPLGIAVIGDPLLAAALAEAALAKRINGRRLRVMDTTSLSALSDVQVAVVVVAASHRRQVVAIARALEERGTLTIGDGEGLARAGLMLSLYPDGDRIRFEANTGAAARSGVTLSSRLLLLARITG